MPSGSAVGNSTGRLAARLTGLTENRPQPPRDLQANTANNVIRWTPPQDDLFTHYYLRVDHDDGDPDYVFPIGQRVVQLFHGTQFFLSTFNDVNGLESSQVTLAFDANAAIGGGGDCDCDTHGFSVIKEVSVNASPTNVGPTDFTPCTGDHLTVFLTRDGTAGRDVTWDSQYKNPPTDLAPDANTLSVVNFVGRSNFWYRTSYETGLTTV